MTQQVVYAIHNFDAENDDEINFRVGDPIVVLERDDKYMDGWWQVYIYIHFFLYNPAPRKSFFHGH